MKNFKILLFLCIAVLTACKKHDSQPDNGCLTVPDLTTTHLAQKDLDKVNAFLTANNITTNFVPQAYYADSVYTFGHYQQPGYWNYSYVYAGYQVINKLPVLNGLIFRQDRANVKTYWVTPRIYSDPNLNPAPKSTVSDIKATYIYLIEKLHNPTLALPNAPYAGKHYADSCLTIKYGYYDTSAAGYYLDPPKLVKAWEISPKSGTPLLRINDETMTFIDGSYPERLYFDN
jgi:hypothetical protein